MLKNKSFFPCLNRQVNNNNNNNGMSAIGVAFALFLCKTIL